MIADAFRAAEKCWDVVLMIDNRFFVDISDFVERLAVSDEGKIWLRRLYGFDCPEKGISPFCAMSENRRWELKTDTTGLLIC